ncbi:MAG: rod shape-determining protein MreD [Bacteroidales bacterium]|nr:rod shape-determining protein MreD [Bacteroidales bacterium]
MIIKSILRFFLVILFQVLVFNNIQFSGYINPYFYLLFILLLPIKTPAWLSLISAFALGYTIDIFSQSPGLHASASVFIAFIRPYVIRSVKSSGEINQDLEPSLSNMGFRWFISYALLLILFHHFFYFFLEVFRFSNFLDTFYRVIISSFTTFITIIIAQLFTYKKS